MIAILADVFWLAARPGNLLLIALMVAVAFSWTRWRAFARYLAAIVVSILLLIAVLPLHVWLGGPLEARCQASGVLPDDIHGIIMLGGAVHDRPGTRQHEVVLNDAAERFTEFVRLAHRYPKARLAVTGRGESGPATQRLLRDLGLDLSRIVFETQSRDTYENALFARALIEPGPAETWLMVTSAQHVPRAMGVFRQLDWEILPRPVDFRAHRAGAWVGLVDLGANLKAANEVLYEWVGLFAYWLLGRTGELFPKCS